LNILPVPKDSRDDAMDPVHEEFVKIPKGTGLALCHARDKASVVMERGGIERKHDGAKAYSLVPWISIVRTPQQELSGSKTAVSAWNRTATDPPASIIGMGLVKTGLDGA
jgi:hypothetical protein